MSSVSSITVNINTMEANLGISDRHLAEIDVINAMFVHRDDGWGSLFEEVTFALYTGVLGNGDAAADCGTNHGLHTRAIARACGPDGKVFALEAAPEMMADTKRQTVQFQTITYVERAAWHTADQTLTFNFYPNEDGLSSLRARDNTSVHVAFDVQTTTLDTALSSPVSLIKLDIEGAEYHALLGAERVMKEDRPIIVFENGRSKAAESFDYTRDDFFDLFEGRGYQLYAISGMRLVRENWESLMPWQFLAIHPASPRAQRALSVTQSFAHRLMLNNI